MVPSVTASRSVLPLRGTAGSVAVVRAGELIAGYEPESELERAMTEDPELLEGLAWGTPRPGHPEGSVAAHVSDLLRRIDARGETGERRRLLRLLSIVHDAFKGRVNYRLPRMGENHHAMRARRFAEGYTGEERVLTVIELHDRPYGLWRRWRRTGELGEEAFEAMMGRVKDTELFLAFVELDASTEGKHAEPVAWFREQLEIRGYPVP